MKWKLTEIASEETHSVASFLRIVSGMDMNTVINVR